MQQRRVDFPLILFAGSDPGLGRPGHQLSRKMNGFPGLVLAVCCLVCLLVGCSIQEEVALLYREGYSE